MENREAIEILSRPFSMQEVPKEILDAHRLAISALEKQEQDRWIPVTEILPEYGTTVLTQLSDSDIVVNWVTDEEDEEWFEYGVVAWKPLPEHYTEDNNE